MNNLVPDLSNCIKLRDAGFPQGDSYFVWVLDEDGEKYYPIPRTGMSRWTSDFIAAPHIGELGEWLPDLFAIERNFKAGEERQYICWNNTYPEETFPDGTQYADTMPNAMADMAFWLLENNYV